MEKTFDLIHLDRFMYTVDKEDKSFSVRDRGLYKKWKVGIVTDSNEDILEFEGELIDEYDLWKIIATSNPELALPLLPDVEESTIMQLANEYAFCYPGEQLSEEFDIRATSYFQGARAAASKKYTERDMEKAFEAGRLRGGWNRHGYAKLPLDRHEFIQSLNKLPIAIKLKVYPAPPDNSDPLGYILNTDKNNTVILKQWIY